MMKTKLICSDVIESAVSFDGLFYCLMSILETREFDNNNNNHNNDNNDTTTNNNNAS